MKTFSNSRGCIAARLETLPGWKGLSNGLGKASRHTVTVHFTVYCQAQFLGSQKRSQKCCLAIAVSKDDWQFIVRQYFWDSQA